LTGVLAPGTISTCTITGLSLQNAYSVGDGAFIVVSATATGLSLMNSIKVAVSVGVSQ
jgi:hypothetical protein